MIARANRKAVRRDLAIKFQIGVIEQFSFPDQSFDVVLSTFMMHHLPDDLKRLAGKSERVLDCRRPRWPRRVMLSLLL